MRYLYRNLTLPYGEADDESLTGAVARCLGVDYRLLMDFRIVRKAIDARKKPLLKVVYTVSFSLGDGRILASRLRSDANLIPEELPAPTCFLPVHSSERIIIVGSGPAGLFAALRLAEYGLTATLLERGDALEQRVPTVNRFWDSGLLDSESNVQFGEGGAGTFSDGKLTCRTRGELAPWIFERLVDFGASAEVRYLTKPHIGTDRLRLVITRIRHYLLDRGFQVHFRHRLSGITAHQGQITAVQVNENEELPCDRLIMACGHSARDTYEMLAQAGIPLEQKPFALGVRVEHPQSLINRIQYGNAPYPCLPAADYAVTWNHPTNGRSAYSFCMCPGGIVVGGASESGGVVTNGMSFGARDSGLANSALVVNVRTDDFDGADPLAGVRFQRQWEQRAFAAGGGGYTAPAQGLLGFLGRKHGGMPESSYRPGIREMELDQALPGFVSETLRQALPAFDAKMRGFLSPEAVLIGLESRTSAPLRILRNDRYESPGLAGLYPTGEGAGYAGGIISAAVDGARLADAIAAQLKS